MVAPTLRRRRRISFGSLEQGGTRNSADVGLERTQRLDYASAGLIVALETAEVIANDRPSSRGMQLKDYIWRVSSHKSAVWA
jgi:hypothetical protein